jgi:hypothetical protein
MARMAVSLFITCMFMFWLGANLAGPLVNKLKLFQGLHYVIVIG